MYHDGGYTAELEATEPELTKPDPTKEEASRAGRGGSSELGPRRWSSKEIDPSEIAEIENYSDSGDDNGSGGGDRGGGGGGGGGGGDSKPRATEEHAPSKHAGCPSPGSGPSSSPSNQRNGRSSTSSESKLRARRAAGAAKKAAARKEAARAAGSEQSEATPHPGESSIGERTVTRDEPHPAEGAVAQIEAMDAKHAGRRVEDERARSTYAAQARLEILTVGWIKGTREPPLAQLARLHELTPALSPTLTPTPTPTPTPTLSLSLSP